MKIQCHLRSMPLAHRICLGVSRLHYLPLSGTHYTNLLLCIQLFQARLTVWIEQEGLDRLTPCLKGHNWKKLVML